jgi:hypothetical protein
MLQQYQVYPYNTFDHYHLHNAFDPQSSSPALTWASGYTDGSMSTMP